MSEIAKTGIALGAAAALTAVAFFMKPGEVRLDLFDDQGQEFFEGFTDGDAIAELEVTAFRPASSTIYAFSVKRDDKGVWKIPSHGSYPADAKDQMGKAAAMMIGLTKDAVVGDAKGRHADYGLIDPVAEGVETEGRGKRVKLKDKAGNVLADLIVGNEVEGKTGTYYCRLPEKKRIYKTKLNGSVSTKFADWIETDLLKAQAYNIQKVVFDNYKIDGNRIVPGEKLVLAKGADNKFAFDGVDATKEESNVEKATEIGNTLGEIKIVGVRAKPPGLTAALERANGRDVRTLSAYLQPLGFFLDGKGKLWSNEGDLVFETKSGVRYTLRFGELAAGKGDEVSAGIGGDPKAIDEEAKKSADNRYLMVTAEFVEDLLEKPTGARMAEEELQKRKDARQMIESIQRAVDAYRAANENKLPESLAKLTEKPAEGEPLLGELAPDPWGGDYQFVPEGEGFVISSFGADAAEGGDGLNQDVRTDRLAVEDELAKAAGEWATFDGKVTTGQEEAANLTKRFGPWYYVIDKTLFDKLKPKREDLVKPKAAEAPGEVPGKAPGNGPPK